MRAAQHSTYRRPETCNQDAPGAACSVLTLLADINTGEQEHSEWDLVLLPDFSLTVSVSHSVHSVGASNCSLGSRGQKTNPTNKQSLRRCPALRCGLALHARSYSASGTFTTQPPACRRWRSAAIALRSLWQLQPLASASAPAPAYPFSCACTPAPTCLQPAPAPNFSRLFLDRVPPFPTWLPKSTFTLSRRPHYQMVRFLLSPPSLFSCRDVDEEEDWPPDTDRTLTPAPATTQPQPPERNRRPPVLLR